MTGSPIPVASRSRGLTVVSAVGRRWHALGRSAPCEIAAEVDDAVSVLPPRRLRVVDSREADDGQLIRRRRSCPDCGKRFTTVEEAVLAVVKRSGVTEPFSRPKVMTGVRKACQGRPVDEDALALLAQRVEETIRARGAAEVPSHEVGLAILGPLRELDEVAYLRFASVYRSFDSLDDFEREIAALRAGREQSRGDGGRAGAGRGRPSRARGRADAGTAMQTAQSWSMVSPAVRRAGEGDGMTGAVGTIGANGRGAGRRAAGGLARRAGLHDRGRPPVRRGDLGAPRRRDDELARRLDQLRAARRRVPDVLVRQRGEHRHHQVLPRRRRHPRRASGACASSSTGWCTPTARRARRTATSPAPATPRSSSTS